MKKLLFILLSVFVLFYQLCTTSAQAVTPGMNDEGKYTFNIANVYFEVDPYFGSRISSLKIDGHEMMFIDSTLNGGHVWGSNFWPSPQSWGWPPSEELDNDPYSGGIIGDSVSLLSEVDATYNSYLQFRKTFKASLSDTSVTIRYTMINTASTDNFFSPWELTRVPSGGMAFFPYGSGDITGAFASQVQKENNIAWYKYKASDPAAQKFFSDGSEGWFAYLNDSKEIYIRKFKDVPIDKQAPGEAEIELWFNSSDTYIEMEVQGEYKNIPAGGSVDWTDKWFVRNLPSDIDTSLGSLELANYVRSIVNRTVVNPVGVSEMTADAIRVFPNPVTDKLTIESELSVTNDTYITIFNLQGQEIFKQKKTTKNSIIDVSSWANGVYIYEVLGANNQNQRGKVIVQR